MGPTRHAVAAALADGPVAGPALADQLDVSRAAVWNHVEALREAGFRIDSGEAGYRIVDYPEYGGAAVAAGLDAPFDVEYHDELASTNDRARELAREGAADVAVIAERQTAGRGRLERSWASPAGGVWASVVCRPTIPPGEVPAVTLAAAVAVARTLREAGVDAGIKWPNDVVIGPAGDGAREQKVAGVLTEMEGEADRVSWVVVGVGVNVAVDPDDLPADADATSLAAVCAEPPSRRVVAQRILERFDERRRDLRGALAAWREDATTLGRRVRVETPGGTVEGVARDVDFPGALVVDTDDGRRERVTTGDCTHLRPA